MIQRSTEARLEVLEDRVAGQGAEIQRNRERLHLLEGDRSAIRLAVQALDSLRREIPRIAREVSEQTVRIALDDRDKRHREEEERKRVTFRDLALLVFVTLAVFSFLFDHHLL